ncbi:Pex19 protein family-domain-containing protein [Apiospora arundinis]|uniref:Pex19 protein family-domain-containing protein n=1 Tax=Apiospora arundinis TaxID=335852 RepID=A0ABR2J6I4_9PEZI
MSESKDVPVDGESPTKPDVATSTEHVTETAPAPKPTATTTVDPGDPDEDDLDDLDDMLEEFSAAKIDPQKAGAAKPVTNPTTAKAVPTIPTLAGDVPAADLDDFSEEEFQKQLQAGMAELMGDLDKNPEMQAQFENIFKELGAAAAADGETPASSSSAAPKQPAGGNMKDADKVAADLSADATFQETIRRTMARMQESGEQATAAAAAEGSEDDFMAEMMKAMKDMPGGAGGEGSEEEFSKMLMGMMEQLTNKEILYEPMKELNDKYPGWLEKNGAGLEAEDKKKYEEQSRLVREMVQKFEEPTYKDENVADREYIVERMQKMQSSGSPPADLVGDMPSAKEVLDMPDESCAPQ